MENLKDYINVNNVRKRFTFTLGTMFEGSHVSLKKWFYALYIILSP